MFIDLLILKSSLNRFFCVTDENSVEATTIQDAEDLKIVSREQWHAEPPNAVLDNLELPAELVIIAHTVTSECYNQVI